jgi:hypothetical protein
MRNRTCVLLFLILSLCIYEAPPAKADCSPPASSSYAHETLTVSNTALGFTSGLINQGGGQATFALVTVAVDNVRFWSDGTAPTATVGHIVVAGTPVSVCGFDNIKNFKMIRVTTDATVSVSYFR